MAFDYTKKITNPVDFPTVPGSEQEIREDMQGMFDEIKGAHNDLDSALGAHLAEDVNDVGGAHGFRYEKGTWSPEYKPESGEFTSVTYSRFGQYELIGDTVIIRGHIQTSGLNVGTASGKLYIGDLPFVPGVVTANLSKAAFVGACTRFKNDIKVTNCNIREGPNYIILEIYINASDLNTGTNQNIISFGLTYRI